MRHITYILHKPSYAYIRRLVLVVSFKCMYVYMYVCHHICMYVCMYIYMYVYMYVCICIRILDIKVLRIFYVYLIYKYLYVSAYLVMMLFHIKKVIYVFTYIFSMFLCQRSVHKHAVCMYKTYNGSIHFAFRQVRRDRFQHSPWNVIRSSFIY
jgi:hypothetical protein